MLFTGNNVQERRVFRRVRFQEPVSIQFRDPKKVKGCLSSDLSEGGVQVHLYEFVPLNTEVTVTVQFPDQSVVECLGRVAWIEQIPYSDRYKAGLKFVQNQSYYSLKNRVHKYLQSL